MIKEPVPCTCGFFTWISTDPDVASVDSNGVVYAKKPGTTYVVAFDTNQGTYESCLVTVVPTKTQKARAARTKVKAKAKGGRKVKVTWKKVKGASKYIVYSASKKLGNYRKVKTVKKTSVLLKKQKKGKTIYYRVRPVTKVGKKNITGQWSNAAKAKVR